MNRPAPQEFRTTAEAAQSEFGHNEIAHLAHLNWQKDGRPAGRDLDYWLEAECQLKATWHLLIAASAAAQAAGAIEEIRLQELAVALADGGADDARAQPGNPAEAVA